MVACAPGRRTGETGNQPTGCARWVLAVRLVILAACSSSGVHPDLSLAPGLGSRPGFTTFRVDEPPERHGLNTEAPGATRHCGTFFFGDSNFLLAFKQTG